MNLANSESTKRIYNQRIAIGCGILLILFFFVVAFGLLEAINRDREVVQYPGSVPIAAHSNYSNLPRSYRWDDTFRTDDEFRAVYEWYSVNFNMGSESRANGTCILLEADDEYFRVERFISVVICGAPDSQLVFVSRTTKFR